MSQSYEKLHALYKDAKQDHVFTFYDSLSASQKEELLGQLASVDPHRVNRIFEKAMSTPPIDPANLKIEPLPTSSFDTTIDAAQSKVQQWYETGLAAIQSNSVAVILLAGGQGTRLGSSAPKGCYDVGLHSHKSLFQIQGERIIKLQKIAEQRNKDGKAVVIPWFVMVSGPTRKDTEKFFEGNNYFGLKKENVVFFEQGTLPAMTLSGQMFLENKQSLALSPDGNGGIYSALRSPLSPNSKETPLTKLTSLKIKHIHLYCVDNILVRVADPVFIGYCIQSQAECGAKVVRKTEPLEPVGIICKRNGEFGVVEYSEIPPVMAEERNPDGTLIYRAGNIANHYYSLDFLKHISTEEFENKLPYHIARKKIPTVDYSTGEPFKPEIPNGIKLELFVFDVFPFCKNLAVLEVDRKHEFSPLKNKKGSNNDSEETCRADIYRVCKEWVEKVGGKVENDVEISPLVSYGGEGLEGLKGKSVSGHVDKI
ncbi:nucleotide-diphospho-sugar transferase [Paraphysoderma sedebokerense]|nr:nucleotide-diphospho-sugar transferase [Paraphysoderma sedebokerense]